MLQLVRRKCLRAIDKTVITGNSHVAAKIERKYFFIAETTTVRIEIPTQNLEFSITMDSYKVTSRLR